MPRRGGGHTRQCLGTQSQKAPEGAGTAPRLRCL